MKTLFAAAAILACLSAPMLLAQEAVEQTESAPVTDPPAEEVSPAPKIEPAAPKPTLRPTPPPPIEPLGDPEMELLPLIPDTPPALDLPKPGEAIPQPPDISRELNSERAAAVENELRNRIRLRQIKTKALRDSKIQADWDRAQTARTDYEKRAALTDYYTRLYDRMTKLDNSLKGQIKALRSESLRRVRQHRIAPTEPLEPLDRAAEIRGDEG
ncbi:MAG: hypothetical protein ABI680_06670 [Chthoniobacteraceae bacterium]